MTTFKREAFHICSIDDTARAVLVDGYTFEVEIHDGMKWACGTHKDERGRWHLTDVVTGLLVAGGMRTRRECVEYAESESMRFRMWNYFDSNTELYMAKAEVFQMLVAGTSMSYGEYLVAVNEIAAMKREENRYGEEEPVAEVATETAVVTLEAMKEKGWEDVLVRQRNEGACIWVCGALEAHEEELAEMGFRRGRSKYYGEGWWAKPTMAE